MRLTYRAIRRPNFVLIKKQTAQLIEHWNINFTSRRHLRDLDESRLLDIGIDRATAEKEAKKPFWRK